MSYTLPHGEGLQPGATGCLGTACPVCRQSMAEGDSERYCEECARRVCPGCAVPFGLNDEVLTRRDDASYFECRPCAQKIRSVLEHAA